jgi:HEPN domain-containing protein
MQPHVEEAQRSLRVAARDVRAFRALKDMPDIDLASVCFHAQHAVEKALKAVLFLHQIEFRRTHDLVELAQLLRLHGIRPPANDESLGRLTLFAVTLRYDDLEIPVISRQETAELVADLVGWANRFVQEATQGMDSETNE